MAWRVAPGLAVSGFLMALPGGLLPLWGFHITPDFGTAANYFAAMGVGLAIGGALALRYRKRLTTQKMLAAGCFAAAVALALIALAAPPRGAWFQALALLLAGAAAGVVNTAVFESIGAVFEANPAAITMLGGTFFGAGSVLSSFLISRCFDEIPAARLIILVALLPAALGIRFGQMAWTSPALEPAEAPVLRDLRSVLAVLFALLLFFQFASEWSIAGWLPVFLVDRLGLSPETAVTLLGVYWVSLTLGRVTAGQLLSRIGHGIMLWASASCALFGCIGIMYAAGTGGVVVGILFMGAGFSSIYPLAAEQIATRFSYYHPGYFNGIFTFAMMGGVLAPFVLGHVATATGLRIVPLAAMIQSCAVVALILVIRLGRKVSGR
jgi:fucose permease